MAGEIRILYQDRRILLCLKPPGVVSVDQPGGLPDLLRAQLGGEGAHPPDQDPVRLPGPASGGGRKVRRAGLSYGGYRPVVPQAGI